MMILSGMSLWLSYNPENPDHVVEHVRDVDIAGGVDGDSRRGWRKGSCKGGAAVARIPADSVARDIGDASVRCDSADVGHADPGQAAVRDIKISARVCRNAQLVLSRDGGHAAIGRNLADSTRHGGGDDVAGEIGREIGGEADVVQPIRV